jgi:hypothetical protein
MTMERYWADVRTSLRIFRRSPALAVSAILALAMGVGFPTTMFSIVRGATRSLPFHHPDQIVALTAHRFAADSISTRAASTSSPGPARNAASAAWARSRNRT